MEYSLSLLASLTVVLVGAAGVGFLFHRLRQPLVLGYLLAGVALGLLEGVLGLSSNREHIRFLAQLGVVLLFFSIGLDFHRRRLFNVGLLGAFAALVNLFTLSVLGWWIGRAIGWKAVESLYLATALAITSTLLTVQTLRSLGRALTPQGEVITAILIVEDFLVVGMLAVLSGLTSGNSLTPGSILLLLARLTGFALLVLVLGSLVVPRLAEPIVRSRSSELVVVTVICLCFGMVILSARLGLPLAVGAFLAGGVLAESAHKEQITRLVAPVRDLFGAMFFVTAGMLLNPGALPLAFPWIAVFVAFLVLLKPIVTWLGLFLGGFPGKGALQAGLGMLAVGEFSILLVGVGVEAGAVRQEVYATVIGVAMVTSFLAPIVMRHSPTLTTWIEGCVPRPLHSYGVYLGYWLRNLQALLHSPSPGGRSLREGLLQAGGHLLFIGVVLTVAQLAMTILDDIAARWGLSFRLLVGLLPLAALLLCLPSGLRIWHTLQSVNYTLSTLLSRGHLWRRRIFLVLGNALLIGAMGAIGLAALPMLIGVFSVFGLPLWGVLVLFLFLAAILWRSVFQVHALLQRAMRQGLLGAEGHHPPSPTEKTPPT